MSDVNNLATFEVSDPAVWQKWKDNNSDGYGLGVLSFAARWANLMEAKMAEGHALADIAQQCEREADTEGITGFMYGAAVSTLASCWAHGEELRRWHNLDTQLGNEGEKANEDGGVLNPAIINMRVGE